MIHPLNEVVSNRKYIMISVSEVTKNFDEVHALSEVNVDITAGEFLSLIHI